MFLSRNTKNNEYPCKPQFYYIKVGFKGPLRKIVTSEFGLDNMSLTWPAVVQLLVFIYSGTQYKSSLFIIMINLIFIFSL